jgi:hypothetical protein
VAVIAAARDRFGRKVILTNAAWRHILDGHADLATRRGELLRTLGAPDVVRQDAQDRNRRNYYRVVADWGTPRPLYVKVCVEFGSFGGTIITAHMTRRPKPAEVPLWP